MRNEVHKMVCFHSESDASLPFTSQWMLAQEEDCITMWLCKLSEPPQLNTCHKYQWNRIFSHHFRFISFALGDVTIDGCYLCVLILCVNQNSTQSTSSLALIHPLNWINHSVIRDIFAELGSWLYILEWNVIRSVVCEGLQKTQWKRRWVWTLCI